MLDTGVNPVIQPTLSDIVLRSLRLQIFDGSISPGTQLVETELADLFGVSRGPIREALLHLEQERLVFREPRRGAFVRGVSEEDVREIYGLRQVLECYAAELACGRLSPEDLDGMKALLERMVALRRDAKWEASAELDIMFHRIPVVASSHRRLLQSWDLLGGSLIALTASTAPNYPDVITETHRGHQVLLDAYTSGDLVAIKAAIGAHVAKTETVMLKMLPTNDVASRVFS